MKTYVGQILKDFFKKGKENESLERDWEVLSVVFINPKDIYTESELGKTGIRT